MTTMPSNPVKTHLQASMSDPLHTFARDLCALPANRLGPEFFEEHLLAVERFVLELAELFGADREIVGTATLLYDMAAIQDFTCVPDHAEKGAEEIAALLSSGSLAGGFGFEDYQLDPRYP